jgi:hypothetical protein
MREISKYKVAKVLQLKDGSSIVLLDMLAAPASVPLADRECNIYRVDANGRVVWRVSAGSPIHAGASFTGIGFSTDGRLRAYRWDGVEYEVDEITGMAVPLRFTK